MRLTHLTRVSVTVALLLLPAMAAAQPPPAPALEDPVLSPREVQRLFDAYVAMQAQERLALTDAQYAPFLQRLKALQDVRRRTQSARQALVQELSQIGGAAGASGDEGALRDRLMRLRELDERGALELRQAYEALDQTLNVRQQARFRVFEDQMERRKVELLLRARLNARARVLRQRQRP
jgi:hypothetical protein